MWQGYLDFVHIVALASWAVLILLPRRPFAMALVLYVGVGLLCLAYASALAGVMSGTLAPGGEWSGSVSFFTIEGLRAISANDAGVAIGWVHYLAFDLFVGLWIAKDGDSKGMSRIVQGVVLLLVLLAGPAGLLAWLVLRERRARAMHGRAR